MIRYLQLKHSTLKAKEFVEEFEGNLDDLVREEIEKFREEIKADAKQLGII